MLPRSAQLDLRGYNVGIGPTRGQTVQLVAARHTYTERKDEEKKGEVNRACDLKR